MSEQQIQRVKVKRLAHVGLWSSDVAAQARFYRQVLGFDLRNTIENPTDQDVDLENANVFSLLARNTIAWHCLAIRGPAPAMDAALSRALGCTTWPSSLTLTQNSPHWRPASTSRALNSGWRNETAIPSRAILSGSVTPMGIALKSR